MHKLQLWQRVMASVASAPPQSHDGEKPRERYDDSEDNQACRDGAQRNDRQYDCDGVHRCFANLGDISRTLAACATRAAGGGDIWDIAGDF
jgi:hypothetical protein